MRYDLVVKGRCVLADGILEDGWIAVRDGKITAIGRLEHPTAATLIDSGGDFVIPGLVDGQTHATSYKGLSGIEATSRAALAGMSLSDFLLNEIREVAERPTIEELRARLERRSRVTPSLSPTQAIRAERDSG